MAAVVRPSPRRAGIVVGIGGQGIEAYRAAVRLGAEEAGLRHVPLRLVHGSRPDEQAGDPSLAGMESRQQRGRRLVSGAARGLAGTVLGRDLQISTESSPQTGVDLLLAHSRTAVMLVLQHRDGWSLQAGPTTRAVTAAAGCPTLVTRSDQRSSRGVLLVLDVGPDPAPAIAVAFTEASLRGVTVTVLDVGGDHGRARGALRATRVANAGVAVRYAAIEPGRAAEGVRDLFTAAALVVVVRPDRVETRRLVAMATAEARCPVLTVAPVDVGA